MADAAAPMQIPAYQHQGSWADAGRMQAALFYSRAAQQIPGWVQRSANNAALVDVDFTAARAWQLGLQSADAIVSGFGSTPGNYDTASGKSLRLPPGCSSITFTFDNDTTQTLAVSPGVYTIPNTLNRSLVKRLWVF